ncbi:MAG: hypothetical protein KKE16_06360 [Firmicutes bacterium]|nr:hypothetical protein [Bacillota bacterium]
MKKILVLMMLSLMIGALIPRVNAEEYLTYQEIVFDDDEAMLLKEFSEELYDDYYDLLDKPKFIGWQLGIVNKNQVLEFVSETKLKIVNNGFSTIKHNITLSTKEETKYQISASGSIAVSGKGDIKKFKGSIDADIKASISYASNLTTSETYEFIIIVDPLTYVSIMTRGTGELSNGVGKYFFFWIETKRGGWETFNVTTEYYEIIKEKL